MARQSDLVENLHPEHRGSYPYLLILQHDQVSSVGAVVAAPLTHVRGGPARYRLHPSVILNDQQYVVLMEELAAIPTSSFGRAVGSAEAHRYAIVSALDLLFTGF